MRSSLRSTPRLSLYSIGASEQGLCRDAEPGEAEAEERLRPTAAAAGTRKGNDEIRNRTVSYGTTETGGAIGAFAAAASAAGHSEGEASVGRHEPGGTLEFRELQFWELQRQQRAPASPLPHRGTRGRPGHCVQEADLRLEVGPDQDVLARAKSKFLYYSWLVELMGGCAKRPRKCFM